MSDERDILSAAAELAASGRPFVMMTVVRTEGSTPRDAGAAMIWRPGGAAGRDAAGEIVGTVGGGQFEHMVLEAAARHFEKKSKGMERYVLGADADQCCGGVMEVFFQYHGARQRLVVFGAGHVSHALARLLEAAPLEVVVVDDRAEWITAERFPGARRVGSWGEGVALAQERPEATLAAVMTCSHDTDFDVLRRLLVKPPAFTGLIGSRSKRVCLFGRLVASGLEEEVVKRVHCPIGVGDTGKEPRLVAISIAAQMLMEAQKLAAL